VFGSFGLASAGDEARELVVVVVIGATASRVANVRV
jgi:hypothetical protein